LINLNPTLLVQLAVFLVLMFLLNRILFRPMVRVLDERHDRTAGRREKAAQLDAEAESMLASYQARVQEARAEADRARMALVRQGEAERQKLLDAAAADAEKTVATIRARVRSEAADARKDLHQEADRLAAAAATRILGRII